MQQTKSNLTPAELVDCLGGITVQGVYKALKSHSISTTVTNTRRLLVPAVGVRKLLEERGFKYPKFNLSFQMLKGGAGKTSLSLTLAMRAAQYGAKILCVELDMQSNLTRSFNINAREKSVWINLVRDNVDIRNAIIPITDNLHIIPSNLNNSRLEIELAQANLNLRDLVKDILEPIRNEYDIVIFDCQSAINKTNTTAICASDLIIIPVNPDLYAMDGLDQTTDELLRLKKEFKLIFDYRIVWNKYDARERLAPVYMHQLAKDSERTKKLIPVVIRIDASLKNAISDGRSIFEMQKKANIREDIDQFTKEVLGINQWQEALKNNLTSR